MTTSMFLQELINFYYIPVTKFRARLVDDKKNRKIVLDTDEVKLTIDYLLDNCYFTIVTSTFKQLIGILKDSGPTPFMKNLFLYIFL